MKQIPVAILCVLLLVSGFSMAPLMDEFNGQGDEIMAGPTSLPTRSSTYVVNASGAEDFTTIQAALDFITAGDTIIVRPGTYSEDVYLNKTVELIGEGWEVTIIDGGLTGSPMTINANGCNVSGFTIKDGQWGTAYAGIYCHSNYNTISHCNITNTFYAFRGNTADYNIIEDCRFYQNSRDVYFPSNCDHNTARWNYMEGSFYAGYFAYSNFNKFLNNLVEDTNSGVYLAYADNNTIEGNDMFGIAAGNGIYLNMNCEDNYVGHNYVQDFANGMYTKDNHRNHFQNNDFQNGNYGIYMNNVYDNLYEGNFVYNYGNIGGYLYSAHNNSIIGNTFEDTTVGVQATLGAADNDIFDNIFTDQSSRGVWMIATSTRNNIYHNNFAWNTLHATDFGTNNIWDDGAMGNFWANWTWPDNDYNGIVDIPFTISSAPLIQDLYPVTGPNPWKPRVHNVDSDEYFMKIQEAIDDPDTKPGDRIEIEMGYYYEDVVLNKTVSLIGLPDAFPVTINGSGLVGFNNTIKVEAPYCTIESIEVRGSYPWGSEAGIKVTADYTKIINCEVYDNKHGIYVDNADYTKIENTNCNNNQGNGLYLWESDYNDIGCRFNNNQWYGVYMYYADDNFFHDTEMSYNNWEGLYLYECYWNNFENITVDGNGGDGAYLSYSDDNSFHFSSFTNNQDGIQIDWGSDFNTVNSSFIAYNDYDGVFLIDADDNDIMNCEINNNTYQGVNINTGADYNEIYMNEFRYNNNFGIQGKDDGSSNNWYGWTNGDWWGNWWTDYRNRYMPGPTHDGRVWSWTYWLMGSAGNGDYYPLADALIVDDDNTAGPWNGTKEFPYVNIKMATDNSTANDEICVWEGYYTERVFLSKTLTLRGNGTGVTIINGTGTQDAITIQAHWCNITGVTIEYSGSFTTDAGIYANGRVQTSIWDVEIRNCSLGVFMYSSDFTSIFDSQFHHNDEGVRVQYVDNSYISYNSIWENKNSGINLIRSGTMGENVIIHNELFHNAFGAGKTSAAIYLSFTQSRKNKIGFNYLEDNKNGILFEQSGCMNNLVRGNTFLNTTGFAIITQTSAGPNKFFNNNFINSSTGHVTGSVISDVWNETYPVGGNYWDTYSGFDNFRGANQNIWGADGFGDGAYMIAAGRWDNYPVYNVDGWRRVHNVDQDVWWPAIQPALDWADNGDTIFITNGTYEECIWINTTVNLTGEHIRGVRINGSFRNDVIKVRAHFVNMSMFTVQNSGTMSNHAGIDIDGYDDFLVEEVEVRWCRDGIWLNYADYGRIRFSDVHHNDYRGIMVTASQGLEVERSFIHHNDGNGIHLVNSGYYWRCWVHNNTIEANGLLSSTTGGVYLWGGNTKNNIFENNYVVGNRKGFFLTISCTLNTIRGNTIANSTNNAVYRVTSSGNTFYHNNFINSSTSHVYGDCTPDIWDNGYPSGGNYWDNYTGNDIFSGMFQNIPGSDRLGDKPMGLSKNKDYYPLYYQYDPVPKPPMITTGNIFSAMVGINYFNDYEAVDPNYDTLNWWVNTNASAWLWINNANGKLQGTPSAGDTGIYWVNVTVEDGTGMFDFRNFTLTVIPYNGPPSITTGDNPNAYESFFYAQDYNATDPESDPLTWILNTNATFLWINSTSGWLNGTPLTADIGWYWVNVTVDDGNFNQDSHNFTLWVYPTNDPPVITTTDDTDAIEDLQYKVDYNATDPEADSLTWYLDTNASFLSIHPFTGNLTGTPGNFDAGKTFWVNVSVTDGNGGWDFTNFTLLIINVNDPPYITTPDVLYATEDVFYSVDYNADEVDPTGDTLTWHLDSNASAWLTINSGSGVLSGTPINSDVGIFWVNVSVDDGNGGWDWSNFTLQVNNTNDPPVIITSDTLTAIEDLLYSRDYDANDPDPTGDSLTWSVHTNAPFLSMAPFTGVLSGTPINSDVGTFWVNVTVSDGKGGLDWSNFTLSVNNVNDAPTITTADQTSATEDVLYSVDYNATDIDPTSDTLTWSLTGNASWLSINSASGVLSGTPVNGDVGWYNVNVSVNDGKGGSDWSLFVLTVYNTNDAPVISTTDDTNADEDSLYSVDYDADDDDGDTLVWSLDTNASFLSIVPSTGVVSGTPVNADVGTYWVYVNVSDGKGGTDSNFFTLTVDNTNDAPVILTSDVTSATEDSLYSVDYNANDVDPTGDTLTWTLDTNASWLSIVGSTGVLSGTPLNDDVGWYWVYVNVSDGNGGSDSANFVLTVSNTNDAPVISTSDLTTSTEDSAYSRDYDATDDDGDTLSWSLNTNATFLSINTNTGVVSGTPLNADVGTYWVYVNVSDGKGGTDSNFFTLTVDNTNDAPVIVTSDVTSATEDSLYSVDYNANDVDPTGDTLTWTLDTNASWLSIVGSTGVLSGTPDNGDVGWYWVYVNVSDGNGGSDSANFVLTVSNTNDAPSITTSDVTTATEDSVYSRNYDATDDDGDTLSWTLDTNASFLSINPSTGVVSGTPLNSHVGTYWVYVNVSDGKGGEDSNSFTLTVNNVNDDPVITTGDLNSATQDTAYGNGYNATDVDPTSDTLTWDMDTDAGWLSFNPSTRYLWGTPVFADIGSYWVNVSVTDGNGGKDWHNFTLTVYGSGINSPPSITTSDNTTADEDLFYSVDYNANDIEGDTLQWNLTTNASWLSINSTYGYLNGTPTNAHAGKTYWVNVTCWDGTDEDWSNFTIIVYNTNDPPVISTSDTTTATEDSLYSVNYDANDPDPTGDTLGWSLKTNATWLSINSGTGVLSGTPNNNHAGKTYWVNVSVNDGKGGKDWTNFTILVNNVNDDPTITTGDVLYATEDSLYSVDYDATDIDPTSDTFTWTLSTNASWLSIVAGTGVLSGTPDNDDVGWFWVYVNVSDGNGGTDSHNFVLTVNNTNDAPSITTSDVLTATEDSLYSVNYDATDPDPTGDTLTWSLDTNASFLSINTITGVVSGTPLNSHVGTYWVYVNVSDGKGGTDSNSFTLTVNNVNDDPTITTSDVLYATEDSLYSVDYDATDIDPTSDTFTWSLSTNASWLSIVAGTGVLSGTPVNSDVGWYWVYVNVSDGNGGTDSHNFVLTVNNTNDPPSITTSDVLTATEDSLYSVNYDATDPDPTGDTLTWSLDTNASFLSINSITGVVSGTPLNSHVGTYWVYVNVSDGKGGTDSNSFTLTVNNVNDDPVISTGDTLYATEDSLYSVDYDATDIDPTSDTFTWTLSTNASWLSIVAGTGVLSGTPDNDDVGWFWVYVNVSDGNGGTDSHNFVLTVNNTNDDPFITTSDILTATEDTLYSVSYSATDVDPTGDTLLWSLDTNASFLSINPFSGVLSGTPGNSDVGTYWVYVNVSDGKGGTDSNSFTLTVNNVNDPPTITTANDLYADEDSLYSVDYDATDIDPTSDTFTWTLNTNASWLSIIAGTGVLSGTPANADIGTYWVYVNVSDGNGGTDSKFFWLQVNNTNDPPVITTSDVLTATEDSLYSVNYDATDPDPTSDTLVWSLNTNASFLSINPTTGVVSGTPVNSDVGTYWVYVNVSDGKGGKDSAFFTLTVNNVNDPPVITTGNQVSAMEDVLYSKDYNANDIDPTSDVFTWYLNTNASWLSINSATGLLSGTPDNSDVGWYWVNVSVSDGNGGWDWTNFTVTVTNTNDAPVISSSDTASATEDVAYSNDYDATDDDGDSLVWSLKTNATWLSINSATGVLSGTPDNDDVGTFWVNVSVSDGKGGKDWTNFTVTVSNVNDAPVITTSDDISAPEDLLYSVDYNANDDEGDTLTWYLSTDAPWLSINSATGVVSGTPGNADVGTYWVNVSVTDGNGGWDWTNFTVAVSNVNDAPVITTGNTTTATEDIAYSNDYDATDIDVGDTLSWSLDTDADFLSINSGTGVLSGTPDNDDVGVYWVNVTVSDGNGGLDFVNFTLTVNNVNDVPVITTTDDATAPEDSLYSLDYDATEVDVGDTLTWYLETNASWLSINSATGVLSGTPVNADVGTYWVNVSVTDGNGGWDGTNFTVSVSNVNDAPVIGTSDVATATEDAAYSNDYDATDVDPTSDTLTWSLKTDADFLTIVPSTGVLSGTPDNDDVGSYWVNVTVGDGKGGKDWSNFTLNVNNVNDAPVIGTSDITTATEDVSYSNDYDATDVDASYSFTWHLETDAGWLSINSGTGVLSGTPGNSDVGTYWVNVSVDDGSGGWDWSNFTLTVNNVNDAPVIGTSDDTTAPEDSLYSVDYDATDIDPTSDTLTWSLHTNATFLSIHPGTGVLSGTPTNSHVGTYWVNVKVVDGKGGSDFTNFTLTVSNVNDAPVITTGDVTSANQDSAYGNGYNATDVDPTSDTLTWNLHTNATWLNFNTGTRYLYGTPGGLDVGWYWVNISVSDGNGGLDWTNYTLTVFGSGINTPPSISTLDDTDADEDVLYSVNYDATDAQGDNTYWNLSTDADFLSINWTTGWLNGTPDNGDVGTYWVNVTVDDGRGGLDWTNFTLVVNNVNDPPSITAADLLTATEDVLYSKTYTATDIDPTGDTFSWYLETNASWLSINSGTGVLSGTPANADVGTFWVNVSVYDGNGGWDWSNFTVTVSNVNDAPVITTGNTVTTPEDSLYSVDYNANDVDPTSDTLTWTLATNAGWLGINSGTGVLSGTPGNSDVGAYWVNVTVSDGNGGLDWTNFTLTVTNVNDAPVITTADVLYVNEDAYYAVGYNATDVDPTSDTLTWSKWSNAAWLTLNPSTGYLYGLPLNMHVGTYWVNISVSDGKGGLDWTNFTLQVNNTNDAPVIITTDVTSINEDVLYYVDYNATDVDPTGDTLTWSMLSNATWLTIVPATGLLFGTPTNSDVGWYWINVSVSDGKGGLDWTNFAITVHNVNDPPVITTSDVLNAWEETLYKVDYNGTDDENNTLTWHLATDASWLSIVPSTGVLKGTPGNSEVGLFWVNVSLSDGKGGWDWSNFTLTVNNVNDEPVITTTNKVSATEDAPYGQGYNATDEDPTGDTMTWSLHTNATWLTIDSSEGYLYGTPNNTQIGWYWVNVSVDDGNGGKDWTNFTLTVYLSAANVPPLITTTDVASATEDVFYTVDYDADDVNGDTLTWYLSTNASWLSIASASGHLNGTPANADYGTYWVNVSVTDGNGGWDWSNFTMSVANVNDPPVISTVDDTDADEDALYSITYNANDIDPTSDVLTWTGKTNAPWLSFNPVTRTLFGTPDNDDVGAYWVNITVVDGRGGKDWTNFTLTVNNINDQPSITTTNNLVATEDEAYGVGYNATDDDAGDTHTWSLNTNGSWLSINSATGYLYGTPVLADIGWYWVNVTVDDGNGGKDWTNFTVTVYSKTANRPPQITTADVTTATEDVLYFVDYSVSDPDATDTHIWTLQTNASWLGIIAPTGALWGMPANADVGWYWVNVTVTDSKGGSDWSYFILTVINVNDPPVITTADITTASEDALYSNTYAATEVDAGDTLTWALSTNASWLSINTATGYLSGTPVNSHVGWYWVNVSVSDGSGGLDWTTFLLTVMNTNDAPVITTSDNSSAVEDSLYSHSYNATDEDPTLDTLSWSLSSNATWLSINSELGILYGTPANSDVGSFWVNVTVSDGNGGYDFSNFTVYVSNVNDAPIITTTDQTTTPEDAFFSVDYEAVDIDPTADVMTWSMGSNASWLFLNSGTGVLSGTPTYLDIGWFWVNLTVSDGNGGWDWTNFTINVTPVNDNPIMNQSSLNQTPEDIFYYAFQNATDEENDTITWALDTNAPWLSIDSLTGVLSGTPGNSEVGAYWVNVSVADGNGGTAWLNFTLTVLNINDAPVIGTIDNGSATEDLAYLADYDGSDIDPTGDVLTWHLYTNAGWLSIDPSTGILSGTPTNDDAEDTFWVNVSVTDGNGGLDWTNFTIKVDNVNDAPVITTENVGSVDEDTKYRVDYDCIDIDPVNDALTWAVATNAVFLTMDELTGNLTGEPGNEHVGTYWVNVTVFDGTVMVWTNFTLIVVNVNDAPVIETEFLPNATEDSAYSVTLDVSDVDHLLSDLTFAMSTNAGWLVLDQLNGILTGTPRNQHVGTFWVNITVTDGMLEDFRNFTLMVVNTNDAPVWSKEAVNTTIIEGDTLLLKVTATDVDIPYGDKITYSLWMSGNKLDGVINPSSGDINWTIMDAGTYVLQAQATDGKVMIFHNFTVTVEKGNIPPTVTLTRPTDGAVFNALNPHLTWTGSDADGDTLTYYIYLSTEMLNVQMLFSSVRLPVDLKEAQYALGELEKNQTYYWTVVPFDGEDTGVCLSGVWSFTISADAEKNLAPEFLSVPTTTWLINKAWTYNVVCRDPEGQALTLTLDRHPTGMMLDSATGVISWTPLYAGSEQVRILVSDGVQTAKQEFTILVLEDGTVNFHPSINLPDETPPATEGEDWAFTVQASDMNAGDPVLFSLEQSPEGATIDSSGVIHWTPGPNDVGKNHTFVISASDGNGGITKAQIDVFVNENTTTAEEDDDGGLFGVIDWWELMGIIIGILMALVGVMVGAVVARRKFNRLKRIMEEIDFIYEDFHTKPKKCRQLLDEKRLEIAGMLKDGKISREDFLVARNHIDDYIKDLKGGRKKKKATAPELAKVDHDLEVFDAEVIDSEGFAEVESAKTRKAIGVASKMDAGAGATVKLGGWDLGGDIPPEMDGDIPPELESPDIIDLDKDWEDGIAGEIEQGDFDPYRDNLEEGPDRPMLALPPATVFEADFEKKDIPKIDEVFIMTSDGMLIQHFSYKESSMIDEDILASMLTVVQNFIADSFDGSGGLKKLELGNFTILIERGEYLTVVAISSDDNVEKLMKPMGMMVMYIEQTNAETCKDWNGDAGAFVGLEESVNKLVQGKF